MHKYLLSLLLLLFPLIALTKDSTNTAKIKLLHHNSYRELEKHSCFFRINDMEFEYTDDEITFPTTSEHIVDTVYYRYSIDTSYQIFTLCKFRYKESYLLTYNMCNNSIEIHSNDTSFKTPLVRVIVQNYTGKELLEIYTICDNNEKKWDSRAGGLVKTTKGYKLINNELSKPLILVNSCRYGCFPNPIAFEIRKRRSNKKTEDFYGRRDYKYQTILDARFLPLHSDKEKLILEFDFATQQSKLYLE